MYCEKLDYGKLSPELKVRLIEYAKDKLTHTNYLAGYWKPDGTENIDYGYINVFPINQYFRREIEQYFYDNNLSHPEWDNKLFGVQVVTGGGSGRFPPHRDPPYYRVKDFVYILDTGGDNVITSWWKVKDTEPPDNSYHVPIAEEILDEVEAHKTEEDSWYQFDFSEIHSVKNIERLRVAFVTWEKNVK
jgi:hypothetical protein